MPTILFSRSALALLVAPALLRAQTPDTLAARPIPLSEAVSLAQQVPVRLDIVQAGVSVATPFQGVLDAGPHTLAWDGVVNGAPLVDGKVTLALTVADALGDVPIATPLVIDTVAPTLTVVDPTKLAFTVDEAATVTVLVNGRARIVRQVARGRFTVPYEGGAVTSFSAQAQDAAGNFSQLLAG